MITGNKLTEAKARVILGLAERGVLAVYSPHVDEIARNVCDQTYNKRHVPVIPWRFTYEQDQDYPANIILFAEKHDNTPYESWTVWGAWDLLPGLL